MKVIIINISIAYFSLLMIAYFLSDRMIFFPPRSGYKSSPDLIKLTAADGEKIFAYYLPNKRAKYTVLVSHGNAEDIGYLKTFLHEMHDHGFSVFAYDYHGYGLSGGKPTEKNTYLDVNAAYNYLTEVLHIKPENIIIFGHSVGAAVALDLAVRKPVAAVILQGAFVSAFRVVTRIPIIPFDKYENIKKITSLKCPLLMIHGTKDRIIPFWHGKKLYKTASGIKQFYMVEDAGHNNILMVAGKKYWQVISDFVEQKIGKR